MSDLNIDDILGLSDEEPEKDIELKERDKLWLGAYLAVGESSFFHIGISAKVAGHQCADSSLSAAGGRHKKKVQHLIDRWLEEEGFDETTLKGKLLGLIDAETTKFFQHEGEVITERNVGDNAARLKALDMAFKIKGSYAADKVEVTGLSALAERLVKANQRAKDGGSSD